MNRHTALARLIGCIGITLALALSLTLLIPQPSSLGKNVSADVSTTSTSCPEKNGNNKKLKLIRGEALRLRTEQLRSRSKGLDRAMREFAKRKRAPRWVDSVAVQQLSEKSAANKDMPVLRPAAYSAQNYSDGDQEIDFITYSGDYDSWEGIVYVQTPTGDETYSGNVLTPSNDGTNWDVINEVYYPPDGGDPQCDTSRVCFLEITSSVDKHRENQKAVKISHHPAPTRPLFGWLKRWWSCVGDVCGWSDFLCTGSSRFFCRVGQCIGGLFACI